MFDTKGNPVPVESIQDAKTGETIHRVAIDSKLIAEIDKTIQAHQQTTNSFVINSQNFFMILKTQLELLNNIKIADDSIKNTLTSVTKKAKLDPKKPWVFNIQLKCFEYRTPPIVAGMTDAEIKSSNNPSVKPQVINNPGIGVK